MREEKGGSLPGLTEYQYETDKEIQDAHQAAQDHLAAAYFTRLEQAFDDNFPLTAALLAIMERDLRSRLGASDTEIEEGFQRGWYKAAKAVVPLFMDRP